MEHAETAGEGDEIMVGSRTYSTMQPKKLSRIGKDSKTPFFLCFGPDLLDVRSDLNNALSTVVTPRDIRLSDVHSMRNPCVIVRGEESELRKLTTYLVTNERYARP